MKIEIKTHSGESEILEVETYDAQATADIVNGITKNETGNDYNVLILGDNIYSCVDIKAIKMIKEVELIPGEPS